MLGHLRRQPTQRSSTTPICPSGGDGTGRFLCRSSSTMTRHGVRRRFANSTRRARHKRHRIYGTVYLAKIRFACRNSHQHPKSILGGLGTASCTLTAYNASGTMAGEAPITLGAGKQVAMFLDELIATLPSSYQGCFSLHCVGGSVVSVALRQRTSDAALATVAMSPIPANGN